MKRYIHSATNPKLLANQASDMVIEYLESLGFKRIEEYKVTKNIKGYSSGKMIRINFVYRYIDDPEYAWRNDYFDNFNLAMEMYGPDEEGDHNPLTHKGTGYAKLYEGIVDDINEFLIDNEIDALITKHAMGAAGSSSLLDICVYVAK